MKYRNYTEEQKQQAIFLFENGMNKTKISKELDIPRATIKGWTTPKYIKKTDKPRNSYIPIVDFDAYLDTPEKRKAYSFIMAVYLCDGYINIMKNQRTYSIRLCNDTRYPNNTQEWANNLKILFPENVCNIYNPKNSNCNQVKLYSRKIIDLFPQHGAGAKHARKLTILDWQMRIISEYPEQFIRGCIQSDGCIYQQIIKNKKGGKTSYKRYNFVNKSEDIMDLFLSTLKLVGVNKEKYWHESRQIFVAQNFPQESIKILEQIISCKE